MNDYIAAALKGIIEGLTEFIPVSSTGHLIIVRDLLPLPDKLENGFDIFIQLGAILAVVIYFRKRLWLQAARFDKEARHFGLALLIGFLPAAFVGLSCHEMVEEIMMRDSVVAASLIAGGIIMVALERMNLKKRYGTAELLPLKIALFIGLFQCLAILFPGTSRSGATILGALALGVTRTASAEFSFFLALPTLFAATSYKFLQLIMETTLDGRDYTILGIGFVLAFFSGWAAIGFLMRYLKKHTLVPFGIYRIIIGIVVIATLLVRG